MNSVEKIMINTPTPILRILLVVTLVYIVAPVAIIIYFFQNTIKEILKGVREGYIEFWDVSKQALKTMFTPHKTKWKKIWKGEKLT